VVPNLYASMAINDQWHVGIGVNAPFGLKTEYDDGWLGRYQALKSEIKTINVNPAVSYKLNDAWWFGAGANYQQLNATLSNAVNYTGALALGYGAAALAGQIPATVIPSLIAATSGLDSKGTVTGDDYSWGWNAGVMYSLNEDTRVGLAYRSTIKYNVAGNVDFANPAVPTLGGPLAPLNPVVVGVSNAINSTALRNGGVTLDITMPDTASLSYYQRINDLYDVLADVTWTGWSSIKELRIVRTDGSVLSVLPENFRDTWRVSAGINYQYAEKIVLRAGVAFDQSPINDTDRGPRLPDNDRTWLTVGGRFKLSPQSNIDVGAAYIFVKDSSINNAGNPANIPRNGLINGTYNNNVVIVSGQINYRFR
jgi:long-chain fatty acid transport protein